MPLLLDDAEACVDEIFARIGPRIVLAIPLGIGKPHAFADAIYRRALADPSIELTILTALSLARPRAKEHLERALVEPLVERVFGNFEDLAYAAASRAGTLPANVRVIEFFFEPGAYLDNPRAQQDYLSTNYTFVARDLLARGVNVIAQRVARRQVAGRTEYSLASNTDVTLELLPGFAALRAADRPVAVVGEVHSQLPFMLGSARLHEEQFDLILDAPASERDLYAPPNPALGSVDHAIAVNVSTLVRDSGTLQIGIGELGDALVYALLLRHQHNAAWRATALALGAPVDTAPEASEPFSTGLYACTELLVDQLLDLARAGVLRREVYDCLPLSRALASGKVAERFDDGILEALLDCGAGPVLSATEFSVLQGYGVFRSDSRLVRGMLVGGDGRRIPANLADRAARAEIAAHCLGRQLQRGIVAHAGFFIGPRGFYAALRAMPDAERARFEMRGVGFVNQLYGDDSELRRLQRQHARFINTAMMVTLTGAAVSDGLEDGRVVSGVGGQYNFVAMAHALEDARSIICVRATRTRTGQTTSNLVWNYGHITIPRHLRDIVVTEYGVADLRGRTDAEVIAALLGIADSRFQDELLDAAKSAGKLPATYEIPRDRRQNTPERIRDGLAAQRAAGRFSEYPFGTDLTTEEIRLARALRSLAAATGNVPGRVRTLLAALGAGDDPRDRACLQRMGLGDPIGLRARLDRRLVALMLARERAQSA